MKRERRQLTNPFFFILGMAENWQKMIRDRCKNFQAIVLVNLLCFSGQAQSTSLGKRVAKWVMWLWRAACHGSCRLQLPPSNASLDTPHITSNNNRTAPNLAHLRLLPILATDQDRGAGSTECPERCRWVRKHFLNYSPDSCWCLLQLVCCSQHLGQV